MSPKRFIAPRAGLTTRRLFSATFSNRLIMSYKPLNIPSRPPISLHLVTRKYTTTSPERLSPRQLFRKYGTIALSVYLSLTFLVFSSCFAAISFLDLSAKDIDALFSRIKTFLGFPTTQGESEVEEEKKDGILSRFFVWMDIRDPRIQSLTQTFILALALAKLFSPVKLAITATITPSIARRMQALGLDLGQRNIRQVGQDVKQRVKRKMD